MQYPKCSTRRRQKHVLGSTSVNDNETVSLHTSDLTSRAACQSGMFPRVGSRRPWRRPPSPKLNGNRRLPSFSLWICYSSPCSRWTWRWLPRGSQLEVTERNQSCWQTRVMERPTGTSPSLECSPRSQPPSHNLIFSLLWITQLLEDSQRCFWCLSFSLATLQHL